MAQFRMVAITWYRREDYFKIRLIMADTANLPATFDDWQTKAEEKYDALVREGFMVKKVIIDPVGFPDWCKQMNLITNATARAKYSVEFAAATRTDAV